MREDVKALKTENKRITDEMAEKQRKSDAEIKAIRDENKHIRDEIKDIRDEVSKLKLSNESKGKFFLDLRN